MGAIAELLKKEGKPLSEGEIIEKAEKDKEFKPKNEKNVKRHIKQEVERGEVSRLPTYVEGTLRAQNIYYLPQWPVEVTVRKEGGKVVSFDVKVNNNIIITGQTGVRHFYLNVDEQLKDKVKFVKRI